MWENERKLGKARRGEWRDYVPRRIGKEREEGVAVYLSTWQFLDKT